MFKSKSLAKLGPAVANQILEVFYQDAEIAVSQIINSIEQEDYENVRFWAHKMRGAANIVGAMDFEKVCAEIELTIIEGHSSLDHYQEPLTKEFEKIQLFFKQNSQSQKLSALNSIMLVDDSPTAVELHRAIIKKLGLTEKVMALKDGREALDFIIDAVNGAPANCPDLILLDIDMPNMDGIQFIERFNNFVNKSKMRKKIIVAVVTALRNNEDREHFKRKHGVQEYFLKPLRDKDVLSLVDKYFKPI